MNSRRNFIKQSLIVSAGFAGLSNYLLSCSGSGNSSGKHQQGLVNSNKYLELPEGFQVRVISTWGDSMDDGLLVPSRADGMATFAVDGKVVLIRNHENSPEPVEYGAFGKDMLNFSKFNKSLFYDYGYGKTPGQGGTTNIWYNEATGKVEQQFMSLIGTYRNCAGGKTPWNTWITCEEDTTNIGDIAEQSHGYNFEVSALSDGLEEPIPIKAMGRFNHEAVCVSPDTGIVYQTEDAHEGLFYRYIPNKKGDLLAGGELQALVVKGQKSFDTRNWDNQQVAVGQQLEVEWMTLKDINPTQDDLRLRGHQEGAAIFARGEGAWYGDNELFFACTNGGDKRYGQVYKYTPSKYEGKPEEKDNPGVLTLFAESNDDQILKSCDNLTIAPWGDVILVEDRSNAHIRGITPQGKIYTIGRNIYSDSELTGVCFSPSGKTMFVNIQEDGITLAVTGDWDKVRKLS